MDEMCLPPFRRACTLWPHAAEHANEIYNHSRRPSPEQRDIVEPIVLEGRAFLWLARKVICRLEKTTLVLLDVCDHAGKKRWSSVTVVIHWPSRRYFVGWNRSVPRGINIATSSDDGAIEEVFTSTTVGSRDTVFLLFRGAGMRSATEAKNSRSSAI